MKKNLVLFFICTIIAVACNKKASPAKTVTENSITSPVIPVTEKKEDMVAVIKPADPVVKTMSPEEVAIAGKNLYAAKCTRCHGDKGVGNFTADRWDGILKSMIPKAKLSDEEASQVTAFIKANCKK